MKNYITSTPAPVQLQSKSSASDWTGSVGCAVCSGSKCGSWTAVKWASQNIPIITRNREMVIDIPITTLLVFKQERAVVEGRQLDKPIIKVSVDAPFYRVVLDELGEICTSAAYHYVCGCCECARVKVWPILHALTL